MASINGFSVLEFGDPALAKYRIPGTDARLSLRREVAKLLVGLAADFNKNVEELKPKSCWGHDHRKIKNSASWSYHAPGIAMDFNASRHPQGESGTFTGDQVTGIRRLLKDYSYHGVRLFRWGGDFHSNVDEMHFEIIVPRGIALKAVDSLGQSRGPEVATPTHKPGSRRLELKNPPMEGDDVEFVQRWIGEREAGLPDGSFGPATRAGVRWYQGLRGIDVTGVVDRSTWKNMRIDATF